MALPIALVVPVEVVEGQLPDALLARPAVEEEPGIDAAVAGGNNGGTVCELSDDAEHPLTVRRPVDLVDDDKIGECEMPLDLGMLRARCVELGGVDDLDEPAVHDPRMLTREDHPHELLGLGKPARLDDDDVDTCRGLGEPLQILIELTGVDGTAQTPVPQGNGGIPQRPGHRHGIDLDRAEVVDDGSDPAAATVVQQVIEQGGLPRSEEPGEDDNGDLPGLDRPDLDLLRTGLAQRATSFTPVRTPARGPAPVRGRRTHRHSYEEGMPTQHTSGRNRPEVNDC